MIKDILFHIKHSFSQLSFKRKKETNERFKESFGKLKDDSFKFERIENYFRNKDNSKAHQVLSDKTCNDLDLDDFFTFIDRTNSRVGQQYLYNRLRTVNVNEQQTKLDEEIILKLSRDSEFRISLQKQIEKLKNDEAYYIATLFQDEHLEPPKWFFMIKILAFASLAAIILSYFYPIFFIVLLCLFCVNFVLHFWNKNNLVAYISSIPQLLKLNKVASFLYAEPLLKNLDPNLPKSIMLINEVKIRMWFFQLEAKLQGEFQIIAWFVFEIFKTLFLLEPLLLFGALKTLDTKRNDIESLFKFVGHVDMLMSIASLRKGLDKFCIPNITDENSIVAEGMSHPLIVNCRTNSIEIAKKSILLTGSNMSGKTSFIRAIGLNIISGLTINTCFAKSISFPLLKVFSAIRISDDLMNNKSYYFEEVLTIKEMIDKSEGNERNLFLLDEIFKGVGFPKNRTVNNSNLLTLNSNCHNEKQQI